MHLRAAVVALDLYDEAGDGIYAIAAGLEAQMAKTCAPNKALPTHLAHPQSCQVQRLRRGWVRRTGQRIIKMNAINHDFDNHPTPTAVDIVVARWRETAIKPALACTILPH